MDAFDRRRFLELAAASLALTGQSGCQPRQPKEEIVPYVRSPEYVVPGEPMYYATSLTLGGYATGVLVENHMGRPTRVAGNSDHPASQGGIDAVSQAEILSLYDPNRSQAITNQGKIHTWQDVVQAVQRFLPSQEADQQESPRSGEGIRLLTETVTSPTLADQIQQFLDKYPGAKWHQYEPVNQDNVMRGAERVFGEPVETRFYFDQADVVLSLDSDFLTYGPGHVRYAHDFVARRRLPTHPADNADDAASQLNRLYVVESAVTNTGAMADHRLPAAPSSIVMLTRLLWQLVSDEASLAHSGESNTDHRASNVSEEESAWIGAVAADLKRHRGTSLIVAGPWQPPAVHALVHRINAQLENVGKTVHYTRPVPAEPTYQVDSIRELTDDMTSDQVRLLVIAGGNPVYNAPSDMAFGAALRHVELSLHLGAFEDETSRLCDWHVPAAHELESWSDARAFDGTASIIQPMIEPLYDGKTTHQLLSLLLGQPDQSSQDTVKSFWERRLKGDQFDKRWRQALHDGFISNTQFGASSPSLRSEDEMQSAEIEPSGRHLEADPRQLELLFRPDPTIHDGRYASNAWLQELPKPITKLTWGNAALINPQTARELGLENEQVVELRVGQQTRKIPVYAVSGHARKTITVALGHGRAHAGGVGTQVGQNVYPLRSSDRLWSARDVSVRGLPSRERLATTQSHHRMEGRDLVRSATWKQFQDDPHFATHAAHQPLRSLYNYSSQAKERVGDHDYQWGMSINLNTCTGCNACVIACQAENNIPAVGKQEVRRGREMHWIRVDQYFSGNETNPVIHSQPVACMHCENAPCEVVCPVAATVHSTEGLNEMVYNRCVGTRYCSNNCPYKVRRFNFLQYTDEETPVFTLLRNPDVSVRSRGVMEKCTYCVQRINAGRVQAKKANRAIRDGEVVTACQSVCPTEAIQFGDTADPSSRVAKLKSSSLDYGMLTELNTRPRTTYLARITNPNSGIGSPHGSETQHGH